MDLNPSFDTSTVIYGDINSSRSVMEKYYSPDGLVLTAGSLLYSGCADSSINLNLEDLNIILIPGDVLVISIEGQTLTDKVAVGLTWIENF